MQYLLCTLSFDVDCVDRSFVCGCASCLSSSSINGVKPACCTLVHPAWPHPKLIFLAFIHAKDPVLSGEQPEAEDAGPLAVRLRCALAWSSMCLAVMHPHAGDSTATARATTDASNTCAGRQDHHPAAAQQCAASAGDPAVLLPGRLRRCEASRVRQGATAERQVSTPHMPFPKPELVPTLVLHHTTCDATCHAGGRQCVRNLPCRITIPETNPEMDVYRIG